MDKERRRNEKRGHFECAPADGVRRTGLTHAENGRLRGVSRRASTYAHEWCKKTRPGGNGDGHDGKEKEAEDKLKGDSSRNPLKS